ncbi:hypothetical protein WA158_007798 [Blastocystis sp. Blastoise]
MDEKLVKFVFQDEKKLSIPKWIIDKYPSSCLSKTYYVCLECDPDSLETYIDFPMSQLSILIDILITNGDDIDYIEDAQLVDIYNDIHIFFNDSLSSLQSNLFTIIQTRFFNLINEYDDTLAIWKYNVSTNTLFKDIQKYSWFQPVTSSQQITQQHQYFYVAKALMNPDIIERFTILKPFFSFFQIKALQFVYVSEMAGLYSPVSPLLPALFPHLQLLFIVYHSFSKVTMLIPATVILLYTPDIISPSPLLFLHLYISILEGCLPNLKIFPIDYNSFYITGPDFLDDSVYITQLRLLRDQYKEYNYKEVLLNIIPVSLKIGYLLCCVFSCNQLKHLTTISATYLSLTSIHKFYILDFFIKSIDVTCLTALTTIDFTGTFYNCVTDFQTSNPSHLFNRFSTIIMDSSTRHVFLFELSNHIMNNQSSGRLQNILYNYLDANDSDTFYIISLVKNKLLTNQTTFYFNDDITMEMIDDYSWISALFLPNLKELNISLRTETQFLNLLQSIFKNPLTHLTSLTVNNISFNNPSIMEQCFELLTATVFPCLQKFTLKIGCFSRDCIPNIAQLNQGNCFSFLQKTEIYIAQNDDSPFSSTLIQSLSAPTDSNVTIFPDLSTLRSHDIPAYINAVKRGVFKNITHVTFINTLMNDADLHAITREWAKDEGNHIQIIQLASNINITINGYLGLFPILKHKCFPSLQTLLFDAEYVTSELILDFLSEVREGIFPYLNQLYLVYVNQYQNTLQNERNPKKTRHEINQSLATVFKCLEHNSLIQLTTFEMPYLYFTFETETFEEFIGAISRGAFNPVVFGTQFQDIYFPSLSLSTAKTLIRCISEGFITGVHTLGFYIFDDAPNRDQLNDNRKDLLQFIGQFIIPDVITIKFITHEKSCYFDDDTYRHIFTAIKNHVFPSLRSLSISFRYASSKYYSEFVLFHQNSFIQLYMDKESFSFINNVMKQTQCDFEE